MIDSGARLMDEAFERAIAKGEVPGGVVLVGRGDDVLHEKAYGLLARVPEAEPARIGTIYDLASLTKVVATTPAIMCLVERGLLALSDPVSAHIPEWKSDDPGQPAVTLRMLLTHTSGLPPFEKYHETMPPEGAMDAIVRDIGRMPLQAAPGTRFIYSDLGFILLGEIIRRVGGAPLDEFCRAHLFGPLGMADSGFRPCGDVIARTAPTEWCSDPEVPGGRAMLRGVVHDGNARLVGGVSGHAGLFSTARDLALFCRVLLNGGELDGVRVLSRASVEAMTGDQPMPPGGVRRGLGWDIDSSYSTPRGDLLRGGFGHTGWTGTSIWVVPEERLYIIALTNRVHPDGGGDAGPLRARIANITAARFVQPSTRTVPGGEAAG